MALAKTGYSAANLGTTKVQVPVDSNGQIAPPGETVVSTKSFSINRVNADNSLEDNTEVLNFFLNLAQGTQDSLSNEMQVKWEV